MSNNLHSNEQKGFGKFGGKNYFTVITTRHGKCSQLVSKIRSITVISVI